MSSTKKEFDFNAPETTKMREFVCKITDHVNTFSRDAELFNQCMSLEHRTLQQSFTRLCLQWIEHVANDDYATDGRNEGSKKLCKELLEAFAKLPKNEGMSPEICKPSSWLGYI